MKTVSKIAGSVILRLASKVTTLSSSFMGFGNSVEMPKSMLKNR